MGEPDLQRPPKPAKDGGRRVPGALGGTASDIQQRLLRRLRGPVEQGAAAARAFVRRLIALVPRPIARVVGNPLVHATAVLAILVTMAATGDATSYDMLIIQTMAVYAIATLGLNISAGMAGALSLGQGGVFAVGLYTGGALAAKHGWPVWGTLPIALMAGLAVGALMGATASRLGTIGLAMVSLGFTLVVIDLVYELDTITGGSAGLTEILMRFSPGEGEAAEPWVVAAVIFGVLWAVYLAHWRYRGSRFGRASLATRDDAIGASALGLSTYRTMALSFAVGSGIGAVAGLLYGYLQLIVAPSAINVELSILFLVMVVLGGAGSRIGPVLGAVLLVQIPQWLDEYPHVNTIVYGSVLILVMLLLPRGLIGRTAVAVRNQLAGRSRSEGAAEPAAAAAVSEPSAVSAPPDRAPAGAPLLEIKGLGRRFGELVALEDVDLTVSRGEVVGLVGPNGSGKTTLLNVVSGLYPPTSGSVSIDGRRVEGGGAHHVADLGVSRTFQTTRTFPSLGVGEHLAFAADHRSHQIDPQKEEAAAAAAADLLALAGFDVDSPDALDREVRGLSQGQLRLLECATAVYRAPELLLLDEPAAGLSHAEIEGLEEVVRRLAHSTGTAVMIVEHHIDLVKRLVDRIVVLHLGRVLWSGAPDELDSAAEVRSAYLGTMA